MMSKTMVYLEIALFLLPIVSVSTLRTEHLCNGRRTESAGTSGSVELRGNCELTLTNVSSKINIAGISNKSCDGKMSIIVNDHQYCADEMITDTLIDLTDSELVIKAMKTVPFQIFYYRVYELKKDEYSEGVYDGVISSRNYPQPVQTPASYIFSVSGMPLDVFVTYSIISSDTEFEDGQRVKVSSSRELHFDSSASSPASLKYSGERMWIYSRPAISNKQHPIFLLRYQVVVCDVRTVPVVNNTNIPTMPEHDGLMLPGNTTVAYSCAPGYELENPDNNIANCEYEFKNRTGRPNGSDDQLVIAVWTGQEKIRCNEESSATVVVVIVVIVIVLLMLASAGAIHVAKRYKACSEPLPGPLQRKVVAQVQDSSATKQSQLVAGAGTGVNSPHVKKKRRKTTQMSSSKIISGTDAKGKSGSKVTG